MKRKPIPAAIRDKGIREDVVRNLIDTRKNIIGGNTQDAVFFLDRVLSEVDPNWRVGRT